MTDTQSKIEELAKVPPHLELPKNENILKEQVEKQFQKSDESGKWEKEYTFELNYKDQSGKVWKGRFTNKILTIRERQLSGIMRARMNGGLPVESIDALTDEINLIISHLAYSLIQKPEWATNLLELESIEVIQQIYRRVADHEAGFFGWGTAAGKTDLE